jgi:hypothetical protein
MNYCSMRWEKTTFHTNYCCAVTVARNEQIRRCWRTNAVPVLPCHENEGRDDSKPGLALSIPHCTKEDVGFGTIALSSSAKPRTGVARTRSTGLPSIAVSRRPDDKSAEHQARKGRVRSGRDSGTPLVRTRALPLACRQAKVQGASVVWTEGIPPPTANRRSSEEKTIHREAMGSFIRERKRIGRAVARRPRCRTVGCVQIDRAHRLGSCRLVLPGRSCAPFSIGPLIQP